MEERDVGVGGREASVWINGLNSTLIKELKSPY